MIIAFSGWRDWTDREFVNQVVDSTVEHKLVVPYERYDARYMTVIRVGDCPTGVDEMVRTRLEELGLPYERYDADWDNLGRVAGPVRNQDMLRGKGRGNQLADLLIALPHPHRPPYPSSGTWGCVGTAWSWGVDVFLPKYKKGEA